VNLRWAPFLKVKATSLSAAVSISARGRPCTKSIAAEIRALSSGMSGSLSENVWGARPASSAPATTALPVGFSHLLLQAVHGGREPHVQKDGGIDVPGFGIGQGLIEKTGQIPEIRHEHADRSFVKRNGHDFNFSGWHDRSASGRVRSDGVAAADEGFRIRQF
jgi:hypothetical protein